jgi:CRP-like cAMP-binding protein
MSVIFRQSYHRIARTHEWRAWQINTRRKTKVIGSQTYINSETGELIDMNVISIEERDANFHKIWIGHVIESLNVISSKKMKLVFWLFNQMNNENQIIMTYQKIASKNGVSYETVQQTMNALIKSNLIIRISNGVYQINPDAIFKGGQSKRMNILLEYREACNKKA